MSFIPDNYVDHNAYFKDVLDFLVQYEWIYNFQVTHLLVENVISKIPHDWSEALLNSTNDELNALPTGYVKETWPQTLVEFLRKCQQLQVPETKLKPHSLTPLEIPAGLRRGMNPKKQHEVSRFAQIVHKACRELGIRKVLDIGAGLGYLGQILHNEYKYVILGLDEKSSNVHGANKRQEDFSGCSVGVRNETLIISNCESVQEHIGEIVQRLNCMKEVCSCKKSENQHTPRDSATGVCMVGLHACGDLTPTMIRLFSNNPNVRLLVVTSCCYHRMISSGMQDGVSFYNEFPMSLSLKKLVQENCFEKYLNYFLLRLAAQETCVKWPKSVEAHEEHSFHVLARAVLQLYANQEGFTLQKKRRHAVRKTKLTSIDEYVDDVLARFTFAGSTVSNSAIHHEKISQLYQENEELQRLTEIITGLQVCLQSVSEHFVMADRVAFAEENGMSAIVVRAFDDEISPRSLVLLLSKHNVF